jgi:hypothetical protein
MAVERPNDLKMYTKWPIIDQMTIKYTNIFNCKTLQNLTKLVFLV